MSERFFSESRIAGDSVELSGAQTHHLLHVMRLGPGDALVLFDGSGAEFDAVVQETSRSSVRCEVTARREVDRERPEPLVLGVALPKGDRQKVLVEKLTELGVTRLVPLSTTRGVVQPARVALDKLRRTVIEASKQCGRNRLMEVADPLSLAEFLNAAPEHASRRLAHPTGTVPTRAPDKPGYCAIGPEGGFTSDELSSAAQAGWEVVSLGPRILRVETAAIVFAAQLC